MSLAEMARKAMPLSSEIVIDAHAHVGPFASYYIAGNTPAGMVEGMDRIGVQSCWLFPFMLGCEWKRGNEGIPGKVLGPGLHVSELPGRTHSGTGTLPRSRLRWCQTPF